MPSYRLKPVEVEVLRVPYARLVLQVIHDTTPEGEVSKEIEAFAGDRLVLLDDEIAVFSQEKFETQLEEIHIQEEPDAGPVLVDMANLAMGRMAPKPIQQRCRTVRACEEHVRAEDGSIVPAPEARDVAPAKPSLQGLCLKSLEEKARLLGEVWHWVKENGWPQASRESVSATLLTLRHKGKVRTQRIWRMEDSVKTVTTAVLLVLALAVCAVGQVATPPYTKIGSPVPPPAVPVDQLVVDPSTQWAGPAAAGSGPLKVLDPTAPEYTFVPQGTAVPGLDQYQVVACNKSGALMKVTASQLMVQSFQVGISMASYTTLRRAIDQANQRSTWHYIGIAGEVVGWSTTIPISGDLIKIDEKWVKVVVPAVTSALTLGRTLLDRERRDVAEPSDLFPAAGAALDANTCGNWAMFAEVK